jgi:hypothetical protein
MIEILPLKSLRDEDTPIFGKLNILLSKLAVQNLEVAPGIVITPPNLRLKTTLEQYNFESYEVIEQSLTLVKKDLEKIPLPDNLKISLHKHDKFLVDNQVIKGAEKLWLLLLNNWLKDLKQMIWREGFSVGLAEALEAKTVIFTGDLKAFGTTDLDEENSEVIIKILNGTLLPIRLKELDEIVIKANKKLIIPYNFNWILDHGIKLTGVSPYTPSNVVKNSIIINEVENIHSELTNQEVKSAVKILLDLTTGQIPETEFEGSYITGEKIYDLNKPQDSSDRLIIKMLECANTGLPVLLKLADKSEGMGKVRGALRLIHQKTLLDSFTSAIQFCLDQKAARNIQLVIPFIRSVSELAEVKKLLSMRKLGRANIPVWMEVAVPENIINLEEYITNGLDGIVINLDELMSHLSGFDINEQELLFYKKDIKALLNFLEGLKTAQKLKIPILATGSIILYPEVLEYLVEKGIYGVVVERYEAEAGRELLLKMEKKLVISRSS